MNSWKSSRLGACAPPLITLKCGTGSRAVTACGVSQSHSGRPEPAAKARAQAIDTPVIALAPSRDLPGVPSREMSASSSCSRSSQSAERRRSAISPWTDSAAARTPRPPYRPGSPSRRSTASPLPVEAPDGTPARPLVPSEKVTATCSVGRPRESRISSADTSRTRTPVMPTAKHADKSQPPSRLPIIQGQDPLARWRIGRVNTAPAGSTAGSATPAVPAGRRAPAAHPRPMPSWLRWTGGPPALCRAPGAPVSLACLSARVVCITMSCSKEARRSSLTHLVDAFGERRLLPGSGASGGCDVFCSRYQP